MRNIVTPFIVFLFISVTLYCIGIAYLSRKRQLYLGLTLPTISACIAIYNLIKPYLVYNPHPTMKEGFYMAFFGVLSIVGFIIFGVTRCISTSKSDNDI